MKALYKNKPLHLVICILLLWKGLSVLTIPYLRGDILFRVATGFASPFILFWYATFTESIAFTLISAILILASVLLYLLFYVMLCINRKSAGFASVGMMVLCALDLPVTLLLSFEKLGAFVVCIAFNATVFISLLLLRRSRDGHPVETPTEPTVW